MSQFLLTQDLRHLPPWLIFDVRQKSQAMNLADLSSLLTVFIVAIGIPSAANSGGAPFWVVLITIPVAIGLGILAAFANGRMMYRFLGVARKNEKKSEGNLFLYMAWPLVWWSASTVVAVAVGTFTASLIQK